MERDLAGYPRLHDRVRSTPLGGLGRSRLGYGALEFDRIPSGWHGVPTPGACHGDFRAPRRQMARHSYAFFPVSGHTADHPWSEPLTVALRQSIVHRMLARLQHAKTLSVLGMELGKAATRCPKVISERLMAILYRGEGHMDEAIQLAIEMSEANWHNFKNDLKDLTPDEINWRPLPQANNVNVLLKHLRVVEELLLSGLQHGEQSLYQDAS